MNANEIQTNARQMAEYIALQEEATLEQIVLNLRNYVSQQRDTHPFAVAVAAAALELIEAKQA